MRLNYAECERRVLLSEGGYTNNPRDPGGPTNWGITLVDARLHWKPDATAEDVRAMPRSVAERIYKDKYWDALRCDDLPAGLDYTVFDYGVNSGIGRAGKVLRATLGISHDTWHIDEAVIARAWDVDATVTLDAINVERLAFLHRLPTWDEFGGGWGKRIVSVRSFSEHLALVVKGTAAGAGPAHHEPETAAKGYGDHIDVEVPLPRPNPTQMATDGPQSVDPVRSQEPPATQVAPQADAPLRPSHGLGRLAPWMAGGLGATGSLDWLNQMNDYAASLSMAKFNLEQLNVPGALSWLVQHPAAFVGALLPLVLLAAGVWVWDEHSKYKALLAETRK